MIDRRRCLMALSYSPLALVPGCIAKTQPAQHSAFGKTSIEACLAIAFDLSGSFVNELASKAFPMVLRLIDAFDNHAMGSDAGLIVLSQISGNDQAVLFEGSASQLQAEFPSPEAMEAFLRDRAKPDRSPIYTATRQTIDYVNSIAGIGPETKLLTVLCSDLRDSESDRQARSREGYRMLDSLKVYQQKGGAIACYFVDPQEVRRWQRVFELAEFRDEQFLIATELRRDPPLPRLF
ncbi:hypothetical protein U8335_13700 [Roseiconus lacunae]|uniref:hypothetical protein n=1 Tax=Roseiconus lacunae TaxID=2605694 RepID=UPI003088F7E0|nr:hypothetical protein U8335_13700 [Stieleria sp. HD01]